MKRQSKAWLDSARDDLGVVEEIINREDLTHMVAFHCHQAIEKSFKAILEEYEQTVPRVHDLITLHNRTEKHNRLKVESDLLIQLNDLYVDARYPSDFGLLPGGNPRRNYPIRCTISLDQYLRQLSKAWRNRCSETAE